MGEAFLLKKQKNTGRFAWKLSKASVRNNGDVNERNMYHIYFDSTPVTVYCAYSVLLNSDGTINLVNPFTVTISRSNVSALKQTYFVTAKGTANLKLSDVTIYHSSNYSTSYGYTTGFVLIIYPETFIQFAVSDDETAFVDGSVNNGILYQAIP